MLVSSYDRRLVMEVSPPSQQQQHHHHHLARSTLASSLDRAAAVPLNSPLHAPHRRRSSTSQAQIAPLLSPGFFVATATGQKRAPLAPLDPQFTPSQITVTDFEMSPADEGYSSGRKSSCVCIFSIDSSDLLRLVSIQDYFN